MCPAEWFVVKCQDFRPITHWFKMYDRIEMNNSLMKSSSFMYLICFSALFCPFLFNFNCSFSCYTICYVAHPLFLLFLYKQGNSYVGRNLKSNIVPFFLMTWWCLINSFCLILWSLFCNFLRVTVPFNAGHWML